MGWHEKKKQKQSKEQGLKVVLPGPPTFLTYREVIEKCTESVTKCQQVQNALTCAKRVSPKKKNKSTK